MLTERIGAVGIRWRWRLFGVQCVNEARSLWWSSERVQSWFAGARSPSRNTMRVQTRGGGSGWGMSGKLLLLHQQRLVELTLVLLDLLLHVGDCTCNLWVKTDYTKYLEIRQRIKQIERLKTERYTTVNNMRKLPLKFWFSIKAYNYIFFLRKENKLMTHFVTLFLTNSVWFPYLVVGIMWEHLLGTCWGSRHNTNDQCDHTLDDACIDSLAALVV